MADFKELNSLLGEYAVPEKAETGDSANDLHSLLGEYGNESTKNLSAPKEHKSLATDIVQDVGIGTLELPSAVTGLADVPAGLMGFDRPFSKGAEKLGEVTGFQPKKWAEEAEKTVYSPERVAAEQRVSKAWEDYDTDKAGIFSAIGKTLAEPRVLAGTVAKSAPSMAAGMGLARGATALAPALSPVAAGAGGEGAIMAGQQMDQIDESVDPQKAALASVITGVGGGALGYAGGKIAGKLGLSDIETAAAGGTREAGRGALPFYKRIPGGAIQEGLLEEAPQSALEQASQNIAEGKDVSEGMGRAVTQGALAGGVMGAGANILPSGEAAQEVPAPATEEQPAVQPPLDQAPETPIGASELDLRTDEQKASDQAPSIDLSVPGEVPAVDTKESEAFLNSFESAWATTGREPTRVTKKLASEAAKLGIPVTPDDKPMAVVAAMRAEIQARKTPEEISQDVGDTIVAETLAAYPDGKPGIAGKAVIASAGANVLEPQKIAAEQKLAEQLLPTTQRPVNEVVDLNTGEVTPEPVVPEERQSDLSNITDAKMLRDWLAKSDKNPETAAAIFARLKELAEVAPQEPATQEAQDALEKQEASTPDGGGIPLTGTSGEDRDSAIGSTGISPEGQESRDISSTEETTLEPQTPEVEDGKSEDQTAQTAPQEVNAALEEYRNPKDGWETYSHSLKGANTPIEPVTGVSYKVARVIADKANKRKDGYEYRMVAHPQFDTYKVERKAIAVPEAKTPTQIPWKQQKEATFGADRVELDNAPIETKNAKQGETFEDRVERIKKEQLDMLDRLRKEVEEPDKNLAEQIANSAYAKNAKGEMSRSGIVSHHDIAGLKVNIETPAETYRGSKNNEYPPRKMTSHYGNISNVLGKDGDQLDVFINPKASDDQLTNPKSVFVIDQIDPATGKYDETKIMLGYDSEAQAREKYLENYDKGWQGLGAITEMSFDEFKARIDSGENWDAPVAYKEPAVESSEAEQPPITLDMFIKSGDSLAELGTKLGLSEDEVDDALIGKSWPRPSTPYLDLMNEIRGVIEDAKAKIKKPSTGSASAQKAYQTTIQKWNAALDTLNAAEREFENPFSAKVAVSRNYKELPPILKNRFEKRFDGITTGDQARREKYRAESAVKAEALIEFAKTKPKVEETPKFSRTETSEPLPELFESLGRVNKLSQLSDDQLQRIDEHPDAERIRYVQDNFLDLLSELDTNNKVTIKC